MSADSGRVLADSHVVHVGRKLATAEGRLYAEEAASCSRTRRLPA